MHVHFFNLIQLLSTSSHPSTYLHVGLVISLADFLFKSNIILLVTVIGWCNLSCHTILSPALFFPNLHLSNMWSCSFSCFCWQKLLFLLFFFHILSATDVMSLYVGKFSFSWSSHPPTVIHDLLKLNVLSAIIVETFSSYVLSCLYHQYIYITWICLIFFHSSIWGSWAVIFMLLVKNWNNLFLHLMQVCLSITLSCLCTICW